MFIYVGPSMNNKRCGENVLNIIRSTANKKYYSRCRYTVTTAAVTVAYTY
jgi:hypothetical protein